MQENNSIKKISKKILIFFFFLIFKNSIKKKIISFVKKNKKIFKDSNVYISGYDIGYGHTIAYPDKLLKIDKNKTVYVQFFSSKNYHNKYSKHVFKKINILQIFLFKNKFFEEFWLVKKIKNLFLLEKNIQIQKVLKKELLNYTNPKKILLSNKFKEFTEQELKRICKSKDTDNSFELKNVNIQAAKIWGEFYHFMLCGKNNKFINHNKIKIFQKKLGLKIKKKIVTIYIRKKDWGSSTYSDLRNGPQLNDYKKTINYLSRENYKIFILGEYENDEKYFKKNKNIITKYQFKKNYIDYYNICAQYYCDIFIGSCGGALILPVIMNKKLLILDIFPYYYTYPNSIVTYKSIYLNQKKLNEKNILKAFNEYDNQNLKKYNFKNIDKNKILLFTKKIINLKKINFFSKRFFYNGNLKTLRKNLNCIATFS